MYSANLKRLVSTFADNNSAAGTRNETVENVRGYGCTPRKTPSELVNVTASNAIGDELKHHGREIYYESVVKWKHPFTCKYYNGISTITR